MKVPLLLKNKYVLYVLLFIGIVNVLGYIALEDYNSLALFVGLGVLSSYFSKNMSINLIVAILGTSIIAVNNKVKEGFEESLNYKENAQPRDVEDRKSEDRPRQSGEGPEASRGRNKKKRQPAEKAQGLQRNLSNSLESTVNAAEKAVERAQKKKDTERKTLVLVDSEEKEEEKPKQEEKQKEKVQEEQRRKRNGEKCKSADECEGKFCNRGVCGSKAGFQNNVPPSTPAAVEGESDDSIGDRIDYAATMEQAYDNLQKMLGDGGMKGITTETKKLVSQQKDLMQTLNTMAPVLTQAKETLAGMDLPSMGDLGNLLKKFNSKAPNIIK